MTSYSPSDLLISHRLRTRLSLLKPLPPVLDKQDTALEAQRSFKIGEAECARNFGLGPRWRKATVLEVLGSRSYLLSVSNNVWMRHVDQIRARYTSAKGYPALPEHRLKQHRHQMFLPSKRMQYGILLYRYGNRHPQYQSCSPQRHQQSFRSYSMDLCKQHHHQLQLRSSYHLLALLTQGVIHHVTTEFPNALVLTNVFFFICFVLHIYFRWRENFILHM